MDLAEGHHDRVSHALGALDPHITGVLRLGGVERCTRNCVGERADAATMVDSGLRALDLQLIQNCSELSDLGLLELELPREEAEGTSDAEPSTVPIEIMTTVTVPAGTVPAERTATETPWTCPMRAFVTFVT